MQARLIYTLLLLTPASSACDSSDDAADSSDAASPGGADLDELPPVELGGPVELSWACDNPELDCGGIECPTSYQRGPLTVPGHPDQAFIVDYPCDLRENERVTLVLNLHGGGSFANWQRHYFPLKDFTDERRLVVVQPQGLPHERDGSTSTRWTVDGGDDEYIRAVLDFVDEELAERVDFHRFWVVGHSNGGQYGRQIACWEEFEGRVTGHLNLSGTSNANGDFGVACDINFIFGVGDQELSLAVPEPNPVAERLGCGARSAATEIVDDVAGQIYDNSGRVMREGWGGMPAPGSTETHTYRDCDGGLVVADYVRVDKGHTEGYEPEVTAHVIERMLAAPQPN